VAGRAGAAVRVLLACCWRQRFMLVRLAVQSNWLAIFWCVRLCMCRYP